MEGFNFKALELWTCWPADPPTLALPASFLQKIAHLRQHSFHLVDEFIRVARSQRFDERKRLKTCLFDPQWVGCLTIAKIASEKDVQVIIEGGMDRAVCSTPLV